MSALTENGLTVDSLNTILTDIISDFQEIYGSNINTDSNTPDGQALNIFAQNISDLLELLVSVYNSFDPDQASGVILDQRVAINNIQRQAGTFTQQQIDITVDRNVTLEGLDAAANDIDGTGYTVADDAGTEFILLDTTALTAGTATLTFRAKELGSITTIENTITNPVTVVVGVTNINNTTTALEIGANEESDAQLRVRRAQSTANASNGFLNGLLGVVLNLDGVTDASLFENDTSLTDENDIPAHSIWLIAEGGANTDIANAIYERKTAGAGMKGDVEVELTTESGQMRTILFDRPLSKSLFISFDIKQTIPGQTFDEDGIKDYIVNNLSYQIGEAAETSNITAVALDGINSTGGGGVPLNIQVSSDGITYVDYLEVDTLNEKWLVSATNIDISIIP